MKRLKFHRAIVAIAMMLIGWLPSLAHDFEVDGVFYNKTSDNTVAVTFKGNSYNSYIGDVVIPSSVKYNGVTYSVTSIGDHAFYFCESLTNIVIPNSVTSIRDFAFYDCSSLTSVEIPNSVTSIGEWAFFFCESLTSIEIPNSVTSIRDFAFRSCSSLTSVIWNSVRCSDFSNYYNHFENCPNITSFTFGDEVEHIPAYLCYNLSSLTSVEIGNSVTSIGDSAFYGCSSLTSVEIGNSVTSIGKSAFYGCSSLTSVEIGNSVTSIGDKAFLGCSGLTSIQIPNSVTSIGDDAFSDCDSLTSIVVDSGNTIYDSRNGCNAIIETASNTLVAGCQNTIIPNSVTSIGDSAFQSCSSLISIKIPNSVTSIENQAFWHCKSLTSIEIPNSVSSIGNAVFGHCESLTSIEIPNGVTSIGNQAFEGCSSLTSIRIPNSVTSIGNDAFRACSRLTSIRIPNSVTSIGEWAFYGCSSLMSIQIPNSVTSIGGCAFYYCKSLISIEIPNSVTSIGDDAFRDCYSLTSIVIGNSVTSIGYEAFKGCSSLTSIRIPNSVTSIGDYAFWSCTSLTSIEIGNSVTSIGYDAFHNCSRLTKITCLAMTPPTIRLSTFSNYSAELYVPAGCKEAYEAAEYWNNFTNIIELEPELEEGAIFEYKGLTYKVIVKGEELAVIASENGRYFGNIVIPSSVNYNGATYSVTSIGSSAFSGCYSLTSIEIPNSVTSIGEGAFAFCSSLTSIEIPYSVTSIGDDVFFGCESLTSIEIPNSVTSIGDEAFRGCKSLTSIEIPNSVTSIGDEAFWGCSILTSIEIPNSVTSIGYRAFYYCSSLTSIVVDAGNTKYDSRNECNAIIETASNTLIAGCKNTIIPNSVTSIGDYAFSWCSSLTSIQIPYSVTSIGDEAFAQCSSLTSIVVDAGNSKYDSRNDCNAIIETASNTLIAGCQNTIIPNSVTSIGDYAFNWCTSLTSIQIPYSVTSIGNYAFCYCPGLTDVVIGNSVTSIGDYAFYNCESLTKITCWATTPPTIDSDTFSNYSADLYVPAGCKEAYEAAEYWNNFNIKEIPTLSTSIALNQTTATLEVTETITLIATVLPENATDKSVKWSSSDESVATIDANGLVTAIAVGEAIITAATTDGSNLTASCKVTVVPTLAESITLDKTEISLEATETATLIATVLPKATFNKGVEWSSSDETVAVVDENGVVTAVAVGEAIITATTADGSNLSATCKVTVIPTLAEYITLDKTEISLEATETATLIVTVLPELTTDKSVEWTSSDETVAVVDENGVVTAVAVGEATITATTADGSNFSASCKVTVVPTLAVSIELNQTEASVEEKSDLQLIATILPEHTTNKEVAWSSSDKWVASVDNYGLVTMYSAGEVIITATTTDGSNLSATCRINVYSGINGVNGEDVIVATVGDNIVVKNAKLGSVVNVYASNGALIASKEATDGSIVVEAPVKGVYVVTVGKQTVKVII